MSNPLSTPTLRKQLGHTVIIAIVVGFMNSYSDFGNYIVLALDRGLRKRLGEQDLIARAAAATEFLQRCDACYRAHLEHSSCDFGSLTNYQVNILEGGGYTISAVRRWRAFCG